MRRLIGIDYGSKRIGLAIGDRASGISMPWKIVAGQNDPERDAKIVLKEIESAGEKAELFVVGLPQNMDDTEGPQAELSRKFGGYLAEASGVEVVYQDERLSSFAAESKFQPSMQERLKPQRGQRGRGKMKKKKKSFDAVAAAVILESYLQKEEK
jgi:putative Holliday junction resolvase